MTQPSSDHRLCICPFCAEGPLSTVPKGNRWYVRCEHCHARGPLKNSESDARSAWVKANHEHQTLREIIDTSTAIITIKDREGRFLLVNQAMAELMNTSPESMIGCRDADFITDPLLLSFYESSTDGVLESNTGLVTEEISIPMPTGGLRHYSSIKRAVEFGPDKTPAVLIIANDVTELRRANAEIAARERRYLEAMAATGEGIWEWDIYNSLVSHNSHLPEIFGFDPQYHEVSGPLLLDRVYKDDRGHVEQQVRQLMEQGGEFEIQHRVLREDGQLIWIRSRGSVAESDDNGRPLRLVGSIRDITQRKRAEANLEEARKQLEQANSQLENLVEERTSELVELNLELQTLARRDALTGLANRLAADEQLASEFARFRRHQIPYTVMLIDVDHFKRVNDTYGHAMGDRALIHIARLLKNSLRESDLVARFGGEEFLLLVHTDDKQAAIQLAEGIRRHIEVTSLNEDLSFTVSIGIAMAQETDKRAEDAVERADSMLYQAKDAGRNCVRSDGT